MSLITLAMKSLYPNAVLGKDYIIQADSSESEPYLGAWNLPGPRPSAEIIQAEIDRLSEPAEVLARARAPVWTKIKEERDRRKYGGVKVGNYWFLSNEQAIGEYTALALIGAALPGSTVLRANWRTMEDGVTVNMTPDLAKQILSIGFQAVAAIDDVAQAHKAAMLASADPASYDFSAGWPQAFGEAE